MIIQRRCLLNLLLLFGCSITLLAGCDLASYNSPAGYDLAKPQRMDLGKVLVEISGIVYTGDGSLAAISDSRRSVFGINFKTRKLSDITEKVVPEDFDLEDIAVVNGTHYLLSSKGIIFEVPQGVRDTSGVNQYSLELDGANDFETIYHDPSSNSLMILCKNCASDKGKHRKSALRFDLSTKKFDSTEFFSIDTKSVKDLLKNDDADFDPSAAAIHPINKRLYILSSSGSLLVIADNRGSVFEAYSLNPDNFPQAEGITFSPAGDMIVSNEGKYGNANLLIFPFKQQQKKK